MDSKKHKVADVMKKFGLAKTTVLRWEKEGKIPIATRDILGWRYWGEEDFQKVVSVIEQKIATPRVYARTPEPVFQNLGPATATLSLAVHSEIHTPPQLPTPRKLEIVPRDNGRDIAIETFLPKLSKEREVAKKTDLPEPEKKWLNDLDISDFRFGFATLVFALAIFSYSTFASGVVSRAQNLANNFSAVFNHATARTIASGSFVASASAIDAKVFSDFNNLSARLALRGVLTRNFISASIDGLSEGVEVLSGLAYEDYLNFGTDLSKIEIHTAESTGELKEFSRNSYISYRRISRLSYVKFANTVSNVPSSFALAGEALPVFASRLGEMEFYARLTMPDLPEIAFPEPNFAGVIFSNFGGVVRVVFEEQKKLIDSLFTTLPEDGLDKAEPIIPEPVLANEDTVKKLCLEEVCVTKKELRALLEHYGEPSLDINLAEDSI